MFALVSSIRERFTHLGKDYIAPGIYFQGGGRDEIVYGDNDHKMRIYCELQTGRLNRIIDTTSINQWQPPFDNENVSEQEKMLILERLCRYYDAIGTTYKVD